MLSLPPIVDVVVSLLACNALSIAMTLFLKWFLHQWAGSGYPFATTMTFIHMVLKWMLSTAVLKWWANPNNSTSRQQLPRGVYWKFVVPIAVCTSLDLLFSNLAFYYATVTFSTVVKSTQNVWTLLFSVWLGHQRFSWALVAVIMLICSGVALASVHSTQFDLRGFVLLILSAMLGTLQWVLTQSLLKRLDGEIANPVLTTVTLTSPASALCLLPIAAIFEGKDLVRSEFVLDASLLLESQAWIFASGLVAFALIFSKVLLIHKTSALTLGISGSFRDVTLVLFAVVCFGDQLSVVNWLGLMTALGGVFLYTLYKNREHKFSGYEDEKHGHDSETDQDHQDASQGKRDDTDDSEDDLELGKISALPLDPPHRYVVVETPRC